MNKHKVKGKASEAMGGAKQKAGEWTGKDDLHAEGHEQEMKGKAQGAHGHAKDKMQDAKEKIS
jgi:uncharacterized protein YjbJ (UPF0337 family)